MVWTYNQASETYNDTGALWDGLDPAQAITVLIGTPAASTDVTPDIQWDTFSATDNGTNGRSLISFRIEAALSGLTTVTDQAVVKVVNHALNRETHKAVIRSRKPIGRPGYDAVTIVADDLAGLLDDTFIALEIRPSETMVARITALWNAYAPTALNNDLTAVASIGGSLPAQTFTGVTLRQAVEATISLASSSADYYLEPDGRLHVFTSEVNNAPFDIDNDAPTGGERAAEELDIEYDSNSYGNRIYIQGGTPEGSGFFADVAAIAAVGGIVRTFSVQAPDCTTAAMAQTLADMHLGRAKTATPRGSFEITGETICRAGQNILITDAAKGLSAQSFRIRRVTTKVARPGALATSLVFRQNVEFGGSSAGGGFSGGSSASVGSGALVYGNLGGESNTFVTADGVTVTDGT